MFLDVEFDILNDDKVIDTKRLAFASDTSSDDIVEQVKAYTANYSADALAAVTNEAQNKELAQADATIEEIVGVEIAAEKEELPAKK